MSKEWFIEAHMREMEEYLEAHPEATEAEAYDRTADGAYDRMRDNLADLGDRLRMEAQDRPINRIVTKMVRRAA